MQERHGNHRHLLPTYPRDITDCNPSVVYAVDLDSDVRQGLASQFASQVSRVRIRQRWVAVLSTVWTGTLVMAALAVDPTSHWAPGVFVVGIALPLTAVFLDIRRTTIACPWCGFAIRRSRGSFCSSCGVRRENGHAMGQDTSCLWCANNLESGFDDSIRYCACCGLDLDPTRARAAAPN